MNFSLLQSGEPPRTLYHYTSLEALVSIVQSKRLRASSIRFLNDSSESLWFKKHVLSVLQKQAITEAEKDKVAMVIAEMESRPPQSHFVASFTENADDLSQWRAYCPSGLGVSVGFATECLKEQWIANPQGGKAFFLSTSLHRVQYLSDEHKSDLEQAIATLLSGDSQAAENVLYGRMMDTGNILSAVDYSPESIILLANAVANLPITTPTDRVMILQQTIPVWVSLLSPYFKHHAFQSEAEWRKVISKDYRHMPGQQFRQGKSTLIPFVEIELDKKLEGSERVQQPAYFVNEVLVGPTPAPELTVEAVCALFASEGRPEVVVRPSSIPFRSW